MIDEQGGDGIYVVYHRSTHTYHRERYFKDVSLSALLL